MNLLCFRKILLITQVHTIRHGVVKVHDALTAVLIVLIALYCNRRKSRIRTDGLGFTKMTMTRVETTLK